MWRYVPLFLLVLGCGNRSEPSPRTVVAEEKKPSGYDSRMSSLRTAVEKGRISEVKELLKAGADVNDKDDDGQTPLIWATRGGHRAMVWLLLSQGALPSERDNQGCTPLMHAATGNHTEIASIFLSPESALSVGGDLIKQIGLDPKLKLPSVVSQVNDRDKTGQTALMKAAQAGSHDMVKTLVTYPARADISLRDNQGKTAVILAAAGGHQPIVELLVEMMPELKTSMDFVAIKDRSGKTAADYAKAGGFKDTVAYLEECATNPDVGDDQGKTALMLAIDKGDVKKASALIARGANLLAQDKEGRTAMSYAAEKGLAATLQTARYRHGSGYDSALRLYNVPDKQGRTAMMYAAMNGHASCIVVMIEDGSQVYGRKNFDDYVLAMVNADDKEGRNATMHAAAKGQDAAVLAILKAFGESAVADLPGPEKRQKHLTRVDKMGKTALKLAQEGTHTKVAELIQKYAGK